MNGEICDLDALLTGCIIFVGLVGKEVDLGNWEELRCSALHSGPLGPLAPKPGFLEGSAPGWGPSSLTPSPGALCGPSPSLLPGPLRKESVIGATGRWGRALLSK